MEALQSLEAPSYPDRLRLPLDFDPAPLLAEALALGPEGWIEHPVRQNYEGEWRAAPLMAPAGETHPIRMVMSDPGVTRFVPTPFLDAMPATREALKRIPCPLQSVRLLGLAPGSRIKPHRDYDLDVETGTARLHLPLVTDAQVDFRLNGEPVAMKAGSLWYLRLSDEHSVTNRGMAERIHLVIDVLADDWLRELLRRS